MWGPGGKPKPMKGKAKKSYERARVRLRKNEEFEALEWTDEKTGKRVRLSQMGRHTTKKIQAR